MVTGILVQKTSTTLMLQVKHEAKKPFRCNWCGRYFTQKSSMDKHQRDYCRSKPDKKKTSSLPTSLERTITPEPQVQLPQRYDQPVNLTAGVKDISTTSADIGHSHTDNPADMSEHASSQQGLSYDSFPITPNVLPHVYPAHSNIPNSSEVYHSQSMWVTGQTLDPTSAILYHNN